MNPSDAFPDEESTSRATEAAVDATEDHADAEGVDASSSDGYGSTSNLRDLLMSTSPERPLEQIDSPWDPDLGGVTRIYRGFMKMTDFDGMPAIGDIAIGVVEWAQVLNLEEDDAGDDAGDDGGGSAVPTPDGGGAGV